MKLKLTTFLWLFGQLLFLSPLLAQLTFSGEIRPRAELRHGFKSLSAKNQDAAFFIDQRTRLNTRFQMKGVTAFLSLQDVRIWGDQPQLVTQNGTSTGFHQAWAKVKLASKWAIKLGRQEIAYDDHRIFGNVNWAQQARSHDAAMLMYQDSTFKAHLGLAFNQSAPQLAGTLYLTPDNYKTLQFLWLHKDWDRLKVSFLALNNGVQILSQVLPEQTNFSQTLGGRVGWTDHRVKANLALYYQFGKDADFNETKINAYYAAMDVAYKPHEQVNLKLGAELLSGNDMVDINDKNNAFMPLYGTNHKFNGHMDYFYVGNHARNVGLVDVYLQANYIKDRFSTGLTAHSFLSEGKVANFQGEEMSHWLGMELDYSAGYKINEWVVAKLGYSQMFGSETMEVLKGGDKSALNNWAWAMIVIKPSYSVRIKKKDK